MSILVHSARALKFQEGLPRMKGKRSCKIASLYRTLLVYASWLGNEAFKARTCYSSKQACFTLGSVIVISSLLIEISLGNILFFLCKIL